MRLRTILILLATLAGGATAAQGATVLGPALPQGTANTNLCGGGIACTFVNTALGAAGPRQATDGVITSWRIQSGSAGAQVRLRVLRPEGVGSLRSVAAGGLVTTGAGPLTEFPARLPIAAGDTIGVDNNSSALIFAQLGGGGAMIFNPGLSDGVAGIPGFTAPSLIAVLLANATVEADVDRDGFGDESQDLCPGDRTRQAAPCAPDFGVGTVTLSPGKVRLPISASKTVAAKFTLSRPATVTLTVEVRRPGRLVGDTCVAAELAPTAPRCTQKIIVRKVTRSFEAGPRSMTFKARGLPRGAHRVRIDAADANGPTTASAVKLLSITR